MPSTLTNWWPCPQALSRSRWSGANVIITVSRRQVSSLEALTRSLEPVRFTKAWM